MPDGAVYVGRGSIWGNPNRVSTGGTSVHGGPLGIHRCKFGEASALATTLYRDDLLNGRLDYDVDTVITELAGKDLACWCPPDLPCHADVLLEFANKEPE